MNTSRHETTSYQEDVKRKLKQLKTSGAAVIGLSQVKPKLEMPDVVKLDDFSEVFTDIQEVFAEGHHIWEDDSLEVIGQVAPPDDLSGKLTGHIEILPAMTADTAASEEVHEVSEEKFEINSWVSRHLRLSDLEIDDAPLEAEGHEEEIIQYICSYAAEHGIEVDWWDYIPMLEKVSANTLGAAVRQGAISILNDMKPLQDFTLDQACVDAAIAREESDSIFDSIDLLDDSVPLQSFVDTLSESQYAYQVVTNGLELPQEIIIPIACVRSALAAGFEYEVLDLIDKGRLQHIRRSTLREMLLSKPGAQSGAFWSGLMSDIPVDELISYINRGILHVGDVFRHMQEQNVVLDETCMQALVDNYPRELFKRDISTLSLSLQSRLFDYYYREDSNYLETNLEWFNSLREEQYKELLERYSDKLKNYDKYETVLQIFSNASEAIMAQLELDIWPAYQARDEARLNTLDANELRNNRRTQELGYFSEGAYVIDVHGHDEHVSESDIINGFENEHCVKRVAGLKEQAAEKGRWKRIAYIANLKYAIGTEGEQGTYKKKRLFMTEHEAITQFVISMEQLEQLANVNNMPEDAISIRNIIDNVTFIGEPEYEEATRGIATYWKHLLQANPKIQLLVLKGSISTLEGSIKSDEYMFDRILTHFSNEELKRYKGRLIVSADDLVSNEPQNIRTILLDDWTISGAQLRTAAADFIKDRPHLQSTIEIQLIAASKERIALGLEKIDIHDSLPENQIKEIPVLVRAYYLAHDSVHKADTYANTRGSIITGAHSAVDYGFEMAIDIFCSNYKKKMPPLTNIVRPYRIKGYKRKNLKRYYKMTQQKA
ncbi:hypothetical protein EOL96_03460 [Candidatus Saccharibacteria bacterium]|nr:hypothetical protein [Candidatus Saccharibacteria bacterium]